MEVVELGISGSKSRESPNVSSYGFPSLIELKTPHEDLNNIKILILVTKTRQRALRFLFNVLGNELLLLLLLLLLSLLLLLLLLLLEIN